MKVRMLNENSMNRETRRIISDVQDVYKKLLEFNAKVFPDGIPEEIEHLQMEIYYGLEDAYDAAIEGR